MSPGRNTALAGAALVAFALALRAWGVADIQAMTEDESLHVAQAEAFASGHGVDWAWWSPPLFYELLHASMRTLGPGPWGRRLENVVLGAVTPLLVALLGFALFPDRRRIGWFAAVLLAADPLHIVLSRFAFEEIQAVFFFVAAALAIVYAARGRPTLILGAVSLGLALASKHYFPLAALALMVFALTEQPPKAPRRSVALRLGLVAAAVYVATYLPWFARGYGLGELVDFHLDVLRVERSLMATSFSDHALLSASGTAGAWFLVPSMLAVVLEPGQAASRYFVLGRNFVTWLPALPAVACVAFLAWRRRSRADLFVAAGFGMLYLPLLLAGRPIFIHSAVAVLPFAMFAVARAMDLLLDSHRALAITWIALAFARLPRISIRSRPSVGFLKRCTGPSSIGWCSSTRASSDPGRAGRALRSHAILRTC